MNTSTTAVQPLPGDSASYLSAAELEAGLAALPAPPRDTGRLTLLVRRLADGSRELPERVCLTPEEGLPGDAWGRRPPLDLEEQLAVIRDDVATMIAHGQPLTTFGDNLFVDLDLSDANLPAGSRLRVGEAIVEVSPKPHNGCRKFHQRFGPDALRFVQAKATRDQNFRGVYWRVVEPGEVAIGATIQVLSRPG